jgi:hypothetical protein
MKTLQEILNERELITEGEYLNDLHNLLGKTYTPNKISLKNHVTIYHYTGNGYGDINKQKRTSQRKFGRPRTYHTVPVHVHHTEIVK